MSSCGSDGGPETETGQDLEDPPWALYCQRMSAPCGFVYDFKCFLKPNLVSDA